MSYRIRRSEERKFFDHGWLKTFHTFSFGQYYDPHFMGFRDLRVINEDRVAGGQGFPPHSHQDMEIISLVLEGTLAHQDSMGNKSVIKPNALQAMSAGSGITHSEFNPLKEEVHFLQIWILPNKENITPTYQETHLPILPDEWVLLASPDGHHHSLKIQQDASLFAIHLQTSSTLPASRYGWLQVIDGELTLAEHETLKSGDGVAIDPQPPLKIKAITPSRLLYFDLK